MKSHELFARCESRLSGCDPALVRVVRIVSREFPIVVLEGFRSRSRQEHLFDSGRTQLHFPMSKHNSNPSLAVDIAPRPVDWNDRERFSLLAGFMLGVAAVEGVSLRWGGDWDSDRSIADNSFDDLVHFELA